MIREIIFKCNINPNQLTLHCLLANIFNNKHHNKEGLEYKIYYKDKEIYLIINDTHLIGNVINNDYVFKHKLENGKIVDIMLTKTTDHNITFHHHKNGDIVKVYGVIHYAINKGKQKIIKQYGPETKKISNICPIDQYGNFISGTRPHTFDYLQKKTGLDLLDLRFQREQYFKYINPLNFNNIFEEKNKIHFYNAFYLNIEGYIVDEEILNKLYYCSIAQKRSYGFGNLFIVSHNNLLNTNI